MGYCYTREAALFMLADGLGGHPEGEVAACVALQSVASQFQKQAQPQVAHPGVFLADALMTAHREVLREAALRQLADPPRTTLVAALLQAGKATWVHCGDSRLYLLRDGRLVTRTRDHSCLALRAAAGPLQHPIPRHTLLTCLGSRGRPVLDTAGPLTLKQGDKLLLCSDGLWGNLAEAHIVDSLWSRPVAEAVPALVETALRRGGAACDNVTALAVEWETPDFLESTGGISTEGLRRGDFASTLQAAAPEGHAEDLDDAAIERSIAEINEVIRRSASRRN